MKKTYLKRSGTLVRKPLKRPAQARGTAVKRTLKPKKKAWKFVKTHLEECDIAFSREVVKRDGRCRYESDFSYSGETFRCEVREKLTNSHYIGRANWNTRFDPENCIALCLRHHFMDKMLGYEFQKQRREVHGWDGQYTIRMKNILGKERFAALIERSKGKKTRQEAILETQRKYNLRQPGENQQTPPQPVGE